MDLIRASFIAVQADRLWAEARRLWAKADRLWAEARRLCGFSYSTYSAIWEMAYEKD